ncbi:hypothetical protein [Simplicispira hankyongi]|uniref:hypothetical protein n=1 Tax=Simplicispira hankyongi TaxID=2315688 RepID=UPI001315891F|nr:hypothetical protein [Simplicispira hankyongi]
MKTITFRGEVLARPRQAPHIKLAPGSVPKRYPTKPLHAAQTLQSDRLLHDVEVQQ